MALHVSAISVYPIKSARGIAVTEAALVATGLRWDREWMVVSADAGKFITARQIPRLLLVVPGLPAQALSSATWQAQPEDAMTVDAPGMPTLRVPLLPPKLEAGSSRRVKVFEWTGQAQDEGDEVAQWFSQYLGVDCRLVRYAGGASQAADAIRGTDAAYAPGFETTFSDGFPCLLASEASLQDLSAKVDKASCPDLPMTRFRPNLVVRGAQPWEEDRWSGVLLGPDSLKFTAVKPCDRCKMTTLDPASGAEGEEPLSAMGTFRGGKALGLAQLNKTWTHSVFFGKYLVTRHTGCVLRVGDVVVPTLHVDVVEAAAAAKAVMTAAA